MHYVVGDLHGCLESFEHLLRENGLVDAQLNWIGQKHQLWCLGDYTDRGPDGVGVIDLIMRLQREAAQAGGAVNALMGNHDLMLLSAKRFGEVEIPSFKQHGQRMTFRQIWERVGGKRSDLERLTDPHLQWLQSLPALALVNDHLLMHADSLFYLELGESIEEVNANIALVAQSDQIKALDALADMFSSRFAFINGGEETAHELMHQLGGERIVHGHTPIYGIVGYPPQHISEPLVYNDGLCINVDHCLWNGGPGFVLALEN